MCVAFLKCRSDRLHITEELKLPRRKIFGRSEVKREVDQDAARKKSQEEAGLLSLAAFVGPEKPKFQEVMNPLACGTSTTRR